MTDRLQEIARQRANRTLLQRARSEPLEIDLSDYSDEYVAGFLAGQANALQEGWAAVRAVIARFDNQDFSCTSEQREIIDPLRKLLR